MKIDLESARRLTMVRGHYAPALIMPASKYGIAVEMTAFHGEPDDSDGDIYWLTTDKGHAATFGDVSEYELRISTALILDAKRDIRLRGLDGIKADAKLKSILARSPATAAIVIGWEGRGLTVLLSNPL